MKNTNKEVPIGFGSTYIEYDVNEQKSNATILDDTANNVEWLKHNSGGGTGGDANFSTGEAVSDIALNGSDLSIDTSGTVDSKIAAEALIRGNADILLGSDLTNETNNRVNADNLLSGLISTETSERKAEDINLLTYIQDETSERTDIDNLIFDEQVVQDNRITTNEANITSIAEIIATQNNVLELSTQTGIIPEAVEVAVDFTTLKNNYDTTILLVNDTLNNITPVITLEHQYLNFKVNVSVTTSTKTVDIKFYGNAVLLKTETKSVPVGANELTLEIFDLTLTAGTAYNMSITSTSAGGSIQINSGIIYLEGLTSSGGQFSSSVINDKVDFPNNGINEDLNKIDLKADTTYVDTQISAETSRATVAENQLSLLKATISIVDTIEEMTDVLKFYLLRSDGVPV